MTECVYQKGMNISKSIFMNSKLATQKSFSIQKSPYSELIFNFTKVIINSSTVYWLPIDKCVSLRKQ